MTALIGALRVSLSADSANFEAGMRRAQRTANTSAASINKSLGTIKAGLAGFASALTVGLLANTIKKALDYAGSLGEVSQQLGVTTRDLQVFRFAAGQVGVSQEQLETGLSKLTITLGKVAAGAKAPKQALDAIGVSADQLKGKNTGEAFRIIADGLQKVTDRSQRAAIEVALFGKSGAMLDTLLSGGSGAINELSEAADRLGIVLSDEQIQNADETADKLDAVKTVLAAQIASVVADNANSILSLASALGQLTGEIVKFLNSNPQLALGIIGALLGGRVGGLPGAAIGAVGGAFAGQRMAEGAADGNMDLSFRLGQFRQAKSAYINAYQGQKRLGTDREFKRTEAELRRQTALLRQSTEMSKARRNPPKAAVGTDIKPFLAGSGPKPKKPKEDHTDERALREAYQFNNELRRAQQDTLQAQRDLAHTADDRAALDLQLLDMQKEDHEAELQYQVALNKLTKGKDGLTEAQAEQLRVEYNKTDALKRQAVAEDLAAQKAEERAALKDQQYDLQIELLQQESALATNSRDRRAAELRILEAMKMQEKARLEAVIADQQSSELAKKEAQARLAQLDNIYAGRQQIALQQTAGPMEQWANSVRDTTDAMEQLKVQGIEGAVDSLMALTEGFDSFKETALNAIKQIIAELIRMQLMKFALNIIGSATGAPTGAVSLSGGMDFSGFGSAVLNARPFATGGLVRGPGTGKSDSIPAMLSNGEFVMNAGAVSSFGLPFFNAINSGRLTPEMMGGDGGGGSNPLLGLISPVGAMAGGDFNPLSLISPLGSLFFSEGGYVGLPIPRASRGDGFNISPTDARGMGGGMTVNAPITINGNATRETADQIASTLRRRIGAAASKGY